jgi:hypothetical protein
LRGYDFGSRRRGGSADAGPDTFAWPRTRGAPSYDSVFGRFERTFQLPGKGGEFTAFNRRARSIDEHELNLPSWQAWSARDPSGGRAVEQMLLGVSTRRYARSLEPLPAEIAGPAR